jgi:excisionase family DNA binding protein
MDHLNQLTVTVPLDPYLSLRALAAYASLSYRTLRRCIADGLPYYRVRDGRLVVRRSEFDQWMEQWRERGSRQQRAVDEVLAKIQAGFRQKKTPRPK